MDKTARPVVIIGGGITGLTAGYRLAAQGIKTIIVEKEPRVGGLAKSFAYGDFTFDIGPHRFYSEDEKVLSFLDGILGDAATKITRRSGVSFCGTCYPWPLRPASLISLPPRIAAKALLDLLFLRLRRHEGPAANFENHIIRNFGPTLYHAFFKEYTRKFLGMAPGETHADWARLGMQRAVIHNDAAAWTLVSVLKDMMKPAPEDRACFIYPAKGIGQFCDLLADAVVARGGAIIKGHVPRSISFSEHALRSLTLDDGTTLNPGAVIWTAPIDELCRAAGIPCGLTYLSLLIYNVITRVPPKQDYQWCYFGSHDTVFSRVSLPELFNPAAAPKGLHGLCVEVTCMKDDDFWNAPETLLPRIRADLRREGYISGDADVLDVRIERIPCAYPRYGLDYDRELSRARNALSRYANLLPAGRTGLFWYNNMDDSIANGLSIAEQVASNTRPEDGARMAG